MACNGYALTATGPALTVAPLIRCGNGAAHESKASCLACLGHTLGAVTLKGDHMKITMVLTSWVVPYSSVVNSIDTFEGENAEAQAVAHYNTALAKWWQQNNGDACAATGEKNGLTLEAVEFEPIESLRALPACPVMLWGGEHGFQAFIDAESYALLDEAYYKREYDDQGLTRPGYLINSYVAGYKPGGVTEAEKAKYERQQQQGFEALGFDVPKLN